MSYVLGVDLGTTYSAAATARDGSVRIFQLGRHQASIPSVVAVREDGSIATGENALRPGLPPANVAHEFKRRLGDDTPLLLGGTPFGAEALTGSLLSAIVEHVRQERGEDPALVVLTHPAGFGPYKKSFLLESARSANVADALLLAEPEAAAIGYAAGERVSVGDLLAVYDFGGGTLDIAALRKTSSGFELVGSPEGMERFGGSDLDQAVFGHVVAALGEPLKDLDVTNPSVAIALIALRDACREAKESLSFDTHAVIPVMLPGLHTEVRLTRTEFESMIRPRLDETVRMLERVIRSTGSKMSDVSRIVLVGGASRIPLVAETVGQATGRPVALDANPKHAVALGAAQYGAKTLASSEQSLAPEDTVIAEKAVFTSAPATDGSGSSEKPGVDADQASPRSGPPATSVEPQPDSTRSTRRRLIAGLTAILALAVVGVGGWLILSGNSDDPPPPPTSSYPVTALYHVSYGTPEADGSWQGWNPQRDDSAPDDAAPADEPPDNIASDYYPDPGLTSSSDPAAVERDLTLVRDAGIEFIAIVWPTDDAPSDTVVNQVLRACDQLGLKAVFWVQMGDRDPEDLAVESIEEILAGFREHPAVFRTNDATPWLPAGSDRIPVVLAGVEAVTAQQWRRITDRFHQEDVILLAASDDDGYVKVAQFDGLAGHASGDPAEYAWASKLPPNAWYAPTLFPGRSAEHLLEHPPSIGRQAGDTLRSQWAAATSVEQQPNLLFIDSFNDWRMGTQIAPAKANVQEFARDYLTYDPLPPYAYLDLVQALVPGGQN